MMYLVEVQGYSMLPILRDKDITYILKTEKYNIGDILVFKNSINQTIIHRLLRIDKYGEYICKGDNSFEIDRINYSQILGKVVLIKHLTFMCKPFVPSKEFILSSLKINELFCRYDKNFDKTMNTKGYARFLLERKKLYESQYFIDDL